MSIETEFINYLFIFMTSTAYSTHLHLTLIIMHTNIVCSGSMILKLFV
jgi:hypothetical protein